LGFVGYREKLTDSLDQIINCRADIEELELAAAAARADTRRARELAAAEERRKIAVAYDPAFRSIGTETPFANLSGDPAQEYFADGVTENLTTDLSHIRDSFVIARNTAFTNKGKAIDAKAIGKELGVRYVLEGSVQRDRNRVRVNALVMAEAAQGAHAQNLDAIDLAMRGWAVMPPHSNAQQGPG
jgi:TolB-like protein